ncbi:MAG: hypothetical protein Q8R37_04090 [Nanoarchaeota archaeon]|nr:hypothetical protein [Nanoarchaeota archaeon]
MTKITAHGIEELKKQALENPEAVLVLADALQSQSDPRGEFLALNYYLEQNNLSLEQRADYFLHRKKVYQQFFRIESRKDRFRLQNVFYNGWFYTVDQSMELLDNRRCHTQDQWLEWLKSDENEDKWHLASGHLYHASLAALHYNQDHEDKEQQNLVQQCRAMHTQDFKEDWMMTSTRIIYTPEEPDIIIPDYGSVQQQEINLNLVGPSKFINKESKLEQEIKALLGTSDLEEVEQVYSDLTGQKPYLWGINNKPIEENSRALVLGVDDIINFSDNFNINAVSFVSVTRPSRGWSINSKQE